METILFLVWPYVVTVHISAEFIRGNTVDQKYLKLLIADFFSLSLQA